jgi:transcriptional regulator GlxA family with amidase domain
MSLAPKKAQQVAKTAEARRFVFLLLDRFTMLSFASAIEPLRIANRVTGQSLYTWKLAGEGGDVAVCSSWIWG